MLEEINHVSTTPNSYLYLAKKSEYMQYLELQCYFFTCSPLRCIKKDYTDKSIEWMEYKLWLLRCHQPNPHGSNSILKSVGRADWSGLPWKVMETSSYLMGQWTLVCFPYTGGQPNPQQLRRPSLLCILLAPHLGVHVFQFTSDP